MNKKTIITALLALVAILLVSIVTKGQKKNVKSVEVIAVGTDSVLISKQKGRKIEHFNN